MMFSIGYLYSFLRDGKIKGIKTTKNERVLASNKYEIVTISLMRFLLQGEAKKRLDIKNRF